MMNQNNIKIVKATLEDISKLSDLLTELFSMEAEFTPNPEAQKNGLAKIINNPEIGIIFCAKHDDKIVGMINLLFTISTALGGKVALLEDMIVTKNYRRRRIGTQLIQAAIFESKLMDCGRITLLTDRVNYIAHEFYEKLGFQQSGMMTMRLKLQE